MAENDSTQSNKNPHFNNIDRAPDELGWLLQSLPSEFSSLKPASDETIQIAKAAVSHAENSLNTVLCGLEGIGQALFVAFANEECEIDTSNLRSLGCLVQHLAVEAQFFQETANNLGFTITQHEMKSGLAARTV
jgi:hypothetical protein